MSGALDHLDKLAASAFDGYLVRKDLVRKYARQYPVPTYVVEFLLGRYCASTDENEIAEGLEIVEKQLRDRTVRTGEEEPLQSADPRGRPDQAHRYLASSPRCQERLLRCRAAEPRAS
jgi:ATP-dependent Lon protease